MSVTENTKKIESLRSELLGPEKSFDDLTKKLDAAVDLLSYLESDYQKKRDQQSLLSPVWFDHMAVITSVSAAIFVIIVGIVGISFNPLSLVQSDYLKMIVPLSVGIGMIPLIVFSARNNYKYQKINAELSGNLSEMMSIRSKITLLQGKQFDMGPFFGWHNVTPFKIKKDILIELQNIRSYLDSLIQIREDKLGDISQADVKARPILQKAEKEFTPKWIDLVEWSRNLYEDKRLPEVYNQFVSIITSPYVDFKKIEGLKKVVENLLSKYRNESK